VRSVHVLRHAKSSWDDPSLLDHDRPLNGRGKRAAKAMGRHIREAGIAPELVLCSTATRARQTLERIEPVLGERETHVEAALYGASARSLLGRLRAVPDTVGAVLLIGHNPGLQDLVLELAAPGGARRKVEAKFPTAALATLSYEGTSWLELAPGGAQLVGYVRPRDLSA
jgi:phosphohistidine phosphatase